MNQAVLRWALATARWRKSRRSQYGQCVEVAHLVTRKHVAVRDSKQPGSALVLPIGTWAVFTARVIEGGHLQ